MITKYHFPIITESDRLLPLYVVTADIYPQVKIKRPYGIPHHQLLFTVEGSGTIIINSKKYTLQKNSIVYLAPNTPQNYYPNDHWVTIYITYVLNIHSNFFSLQNNAYYPKNNDIYLDIAKQIINLDADVNFCRKSSHMLYQLLLEISNELSTPNYKNNKHHLDEVHEYILNHFKEELELSQLAGICGFAPEYFCKIFKTHYNITPFEYINQLRIQCAKQSLVMSDLSVAQIASDVGFKSPSYFIQLFKRHETITPSEFRRQNQH